ncbi:MAG: hypothetical protein M1839_006499 [Geoglossum umbratile]|nr:MAG: hypothetical protein M1839_006499 [Geoglossum umbratile]
MPTLMTQSGLKRRTSTGDASISPPPLKRKQPSTTTQNDVASFFTPASKKEPEKTTWRVISDSLLIARHDAAEINKTSTLKRRHRIAGFDLDSTIIKSASGNKFGKDASDWKWWNDVVPPTLKSLHTEGYLLVIFTNQGAVSLKSDSKIVKRDQKNLATFKGKVTASLNRLDLPVSVYAATRRDKYRKPRNGMWEEMLQDYDLSSSSLDLEGSFFVGDAAGRPAADGGSRDFSCCDRDFAANIGIQFHTPEEFFLKEAPKSFTRDFDPAAYCNKPGLPAVNQNTPVFSKENMIDIVMFCGSPGSGKSTFYWKHVKPLGYERVNQDILKTLNPEKRAMLPMVAFTSFSSRFREPTLEEGFTDIARIDFHFEGSDKERAVWSRYWI